MHGVAADQLRPLVVVGEHRAAVAVAAQRLGREEARGGDVAERAGHPAPDRPAEALRAVLEQEHPVPLAHLAYRRVVRRQTEQVDGHDDPGCEVRPVLDEPHRLLEFGGIEVERTLVHVDEHRHRTEQRGSFAACEEREVGDEHRVARPDAPRHERELQGVRAVGAGYAVPGADVGGEARLELGDLRAADVAAVLEHAGDARVDAALERLILGIQVTKLHAAPLSAPRRSARTSSRRRCTPGPPKGPLRIRTPIRAAAPERPARAHAAGRPR